MSDDFTIEKNTDLSISVATDMYGDVTTRPVRAYERINNVGLLQKSLAIVDCQYFPFDPAKSCQGGSETWIIEIAKVFTKNNWHVVVFANVQGLMILNGIEYYPFDLLEYRCKYQIFDIVIFSRGMLFSNSIISRRNYMMFHDLGLAKPIPQPEIKNIIKLDRIYALSEYAKQFVKNRIFNLPAEKFFITHNGIDYGLYRPAKHKEISMVWSSCKERGFDFFIKNVMPEITARIPDFILHVCSYNNYGDADYADIPSELKSHVKFHGRLDKKSLADLQCSAKIWCYPNLGYLDLNPNNEFGETFCITAVENLAADNVIITGDFGGLQTTLSGYPLLGREYYADDKIPLSRLSEYGKYLADYCIDALLDKYKPVYDGDKYKYTWDNAFLDFIS